MCTCSPQYGTIGTSILLEAHLSDDMSHILSRAISRLRKNSRTPRCHITPCFTTRAQLGFPPPAWAAAGYYVGVRSGKIPEYSLHVSVRGLAMAGLEPRLPPCLIAANTETWVDLVELLVQRDQFGVAQQPVVLVVQVEDIA